ncbi:zinc-ribbon domain-containing protein [uncultured Methanobrevibacter sp.]|uniref:zinc-ribbon domain-containing protein n=1 Tax=uncultured Methanobrevibacter sp. TaxID=253161 RepID=UPI0025F655E0|nr:zinc-ribbon domain-containing protein [uncultured Methanobrevibacter sp.]
MDKCPNCGVDVKSSAKRCTKCGADLTKKTNSSSKLIIGVVVVIIIIAIAGAFASGVFNSNTQDKVPVKEDTHVETVEPAADNDSSSDSSANTEFWASAKAEKFHTPDCEWAQKISDSNKIIYHSRDDAIEDGKVPCSVCNP